MSVDKSSTDEIEAIVRKYASAFDKSGPERLAQLRPLTTPEFLNHINGPGGMGHPVVWLRSKTEILKTETVKPDTALVWVGGGFRGVYVTSVIAVKRVEGKWVVAGGSEVTP
ncbi:hypothetical protein ACFL59_08230 [Planctomycetota bacterium]